MTAAAEPNAPYEVGQIWSYHHRPSDEASLVRIVSIEGDGDGAIYHIGLIGLKLPCNGDAGDVAHLPVSEKTMRDSLVAPVESAAEFPDAAEGIAEWRRAEGGIFTISIAEIADVLEQTMCSPDRIMSD